MTPRIIPFIFNWQKQFENAKRNEDQLKEVFDDVYVINSDPNHTRDGWINIGEEAYFTKQFFKAIELFEGDILFHLQADANYGDWPAVFDNALKYFRKYNWGVFAPNIDYSGWGSELVDIESNYLVEPELRLVSCTDCTCWFIHRDIIRHCVDRKSLFSRNNYGWGVDLSMAALSYLSRRPVIRDYSHTINHPRGTSYNAKAARIEMKAFRASIDEELKPILNLILNDRQALSQIKFSAVNMTNVTAVIPAYNEASRIANTLRVIQPYVDELIVIDDASTDDTATIAKENGAKVIIHERNTGYIEAIKSGFKEASSKIVITIDADGEFMAQDIPKLIKPIIDGDADMVQGHRDFVPRPSEKVITWFAQRKTDVGDSGTGLRALRTDLARTLKLKGACICGIFALEVASKGGQIKEVPITLQKVEKPRKIAWFHLRQLFYLVPWYFKKFKKPDITFKCR